MSRSVCHWYHSQKNILDCPSNVPGYYYNTPWMMQIGPGPQKQHKQHQRIAIVVTGTLQRYSLNATLEHVIRPLVFQQGHAVDTFVSLTTQSAPSFRSESQYMAHLTWDPLLFLAASKKKQTRHKQHSLPSSTRELESFIQSRMRLAGAVPRHVQLYEDSPSKWEDDPSMQRLLRETQASSAWKFPSPHDPYLRFPIRDQRRGAQNRTDQANRNILTVFHSLQELWNQVVEMETNLGVPYDYVLFLRDDAQFLLDWDLNRLLLQHSSNKTEEKQVDAFLLSCDARAPPMHPLEINDHGGLYSRKAAGIYGEYWKALLQDGVMEQCSAQLDGVFRKQRGCNSEMLLRWILLHHKQHNLTNIQTVGQASLPFQRAVHVRMPDGTVQACFHKYCQSQQDRLLTNGALKMCKELTF
jgi:hypothetical protein